MEPQAMPTMDALTKGVYPIKDWLRYYVNIWTRNLAARCIDVQTDTDLKAKNPDEPVNRDDGGGETLVKIRLENRKIAVQDAINLIAAATRLLESSDEQIATFLSAEALAVAADMMPKAPETKAGDVCTMADGTAGVLQDDGKGNLVCALLPATTKNYIVLKEWNSLAVGAVATLDDETAAPLLADGTLHLDTAPDAGAKV